jgi:hypothetical protein
MYIPSTFVHTKSFCFIVSYQTENKPDYISYQQTERYTIYHYWRIPKCRKREVVLVQRQNYAFLFLKWRKEMEVKLVFEIKKNCLVAPI